MTENTYILAVDPGNEKTGVAIVTPDGSMVCRNIISTKTFNDDIERLLTEYYGIVHIVCGNGTNHKHLYPSLQQIGRNHKITTSLIDERYTKQLAQSKAEVKEETISSSELEEKRLHAMEQLYGKGEVHDK